MDHYRASKARIWAAQRPYDLAIGPTDDAVVADELSRAPGRHLTYGPGGDWRVEGDRLVTADGTVLVEVGELWRSTPHDISNALAASAAALGAGATLDGIRTALRRFRGLPHRITPVGEDGGVRFYDDSKATDPHAALAAVRSFDSVVLLAGGRNKGLDLSVLAEVADRLRGVVAIGDASPEIVAAFEPTGVPVVTAGSMDQAVRAARAMAEPGDAVLLSPGCASFDWYRNYGERGDDFARAVQESMCNA
jgi:UDP-N-acetylmuramoylalanine--D-glutamate ligase